MIDLRQLECFCCVVRSGSVSKAAAVLGIGQPALSRQVQRLEENVGSQLLYRNGRGVALTASGTRFHASVSDLIGKLKEACHVASDDGAVPSGPVSLGLLTSMSGLVGAPVFQALKTRWPDIKLNLIDGFSGHVHEWLLSGRLDLAILHDACHTPAISVEPLLAEDLFLVGRDRPACPSLDDHAGTVAFGDLAALRLIVSGPDHGLRRQLNRISAETGVALDIDSDLDSLVALTELVRSGFAHTILPLGCFYRDVADGTLHAWRIVRPTIVNRLVLATANNRPMTTAMHAVRHALRAEIEALAQQKIGWNGFSQAGATFRAEERTTAR